MGLLSEALSERAVVLDGGLASELERGGHDLSSALWSAELLISNPAAILDVHRAYFSAGAEVATTASYQASLDALAAQGADGETLLRLSVELARRARDEHGSGWVAASIGPYGAVLADGSEYRGDYGLSVAQLRTFHRRRMQVLADAGADVLACETVPCLAEVEALVTELDTLGVPAWLSVTCAGDRTRAGELLVEAFELAADCPSVFAVGVNCVAPGDVELATLLASRFGKPVVVYPNSGETWDAQTRTWTGRGSFDSDSVDTWVAAGARLVGGCCRVGPTEIEALAQHLRAG